MIDIISKNGEIKVVNHLNRRNEDPNLTTEEIEAIDFFYSELEKIGFDTENLKEQRRALAYISIVYKDYDFLRLKIGPKAKWVSIDMWASDTFKSDERTNHIKNRNQRHWKFPLNETEDLKKYMDMISDSLRAAIEFKDK